MANLKNKPRKQKIRRKAKNINLKISSSAIQRLRLSIGLKNALKLSIIATVVISGLALSFITIKKQYQKSQNYRISQIEINCDQTIPEQTIIQIAGIEQGQQIWQADLNKIKDRLESVVEIKSATVLRQFPNKIILDIKLRIPMAKLILESQPENKSNYYIDKTGLIWRKKFFNANIFANFDKNLPKLHLRNFTAFKLGEKIKSHAIFSALQTYQEITLLNNFKRWQLQSIIIKNQFMYDLKFNVNIKKTPMTNRTITITMVAENEATQIAQLIKINKHMFAQNLLTKNTQTNKFIPNSINLSVPEKIIIRDYQNKIHFANYNQINNTKNFTNTSPQNHHYLQQKTKPITQNFTPNNHKNFYAQNLQIKNKYHQKQEAVVNLLKMP